jgi:hypothetical protein
VTFVVHYDLSDDALQRYQESNGQGEVIEDVLPVEEGEEVLSVEEVDEVLPVDALPEDDLPLVLAEEAEPVEDVPPELSIFEGDDSHWQVPESRLRDLLWELDDQVEADQE